MSEKDYIRGSRAAHRNMMITCMKELAGDDDLSSARLLAERDEAISILRDVCAEYGDNEWDDSLHLADIIGKHLRPHLDAILRRHHFDAIEEWVEKTEESPKSDGPPSLDPYGYRALTRNTQTGAEDTDA